MQDAPSTPVMANEQKESSSKPRILSLAPLLPYFLRLLGFYLLAVLIDDVSGWSSASDIARFRVEPNYFPIPSPKAFFHSAWIWGAFFIVSRRWSPRLRSLLAISALRHALPDPDKLTTQDAILQDRDQLSAAEIGALNRLTVMKEIDQRVDRLRERATLILGSIACSLLAAAFVVLFAGRLTSLDAAAVSNIDKVKTEIIGAESDLNKLFKFKDLFSELETLQGRASVPKDSGEASILAKQIEDKKKEIGGLRFANTLSPPENVASATSMIKITQDHLTSLADLMGQVWKTELLAERGYGDWRYIVATAVTRVGVVLIIVFLVQILMGLYRYNTRLITYYNSRRDLLALWEGDQKKLHELNAVMAPPTFDFGKDPKHPLEDVIRAFGGYLNKSESGAPTRKSKGKGKEAEGEES